MVSAPGAEIDKSPPRTGKVLIRWAHKVGPLRGSCAGTDNDPARDANHLISHGQVLGAGSGVGARNPYRMNHINCMIHSL